MTDKYEIAGSQLRPPFPEGDPRRGFEWLDDERLEMYFGDKVAERMKDRPPPDE